MKSGDMRTLVESLWFKNYRRSHCRDLGLEIGLQDKIFGLGLGLSVRDLGLGV